jgi:3-oxoacyl-[acyl-carrier protein] reductase
VFVNAAGTTRRIAHSDLDALDDATFDEIYRVNVRGTFSAAKAFAPLLRASGDGVLVNISSLSALTGKGRSVAYCASKAAVDTMGQSLARVLAPEVRVIAISPRCRRHRLRSRPRPQCGRGTGADDALADPRRPRRCRGL